MSIIKDYRAIYEYRNRRQERVDGRRLDEEWNRGKPVEEEFPIRKRVTVGVKEPYDFREIDWLLDSIIQEAETIKLFAEKNDGIGEDITERCVDIIQKNVRYLTFHMREANADSAFFAGELDDYLGEKDVIYPEVEEDRLDADDDIQWITVNGAHIPIDDDGGLGGKVGDKIEEHTEKARSEKKEPVTRRRVNQKLNEIADSDKSEEEKVATIAEELNALRNGTKLVMPDSWDDDDGKKQIYTYNKDLGVWEDNHGWGSMDSTELSYYFLDKDPAERPKIQSVPRDPESVEASRKRREESKNYAMNPDGSIDGKYTLDFHNDHVSQEERDEFSKEIKDMVAYEKGFEEDRSLYRMEANRVGEKIQDEIKRRAALRKGDKENSPINEQPQVEDIYDTLKDMREFGMPEGYEPRVNSDLPQDRTDAIVKEAFDRFPTDWLRETTSRPVINIIDGPGRAICMNEGYINVYTQKDIGLGNGELVTLNDRALVNDLAHELGHHVEMTNRKVRDSAQDCLYERGRDSEVIQVEPGYNGYKDSFFNPYMGKIYSHGGTEIISMVMGNIGCFQPFSVLEGHEYDFTKGKYDGRKKRDKESLKYALGVLAGL